MRIKKKYIPINLNHKREPWIGPNVCQSLKPDFI